MDPAETNMNGVHQGRRFSFTISPTATLMSWDLPREASKHLCVANVDTPASAMFHALCRKVGAGAGGLGGLLRAADDEKAQDNLDGAKAKLPPPKPGSGWINDVVARATQHENGASDSLLQLLRPRLQRQLLDSRLPSFNYTPIVEAVNSENLQKELEEVAVIFWKTASKKCTEVQEPLSRFRQQVERIVELKRQAALLKDESEASWRRRFIIETLQAHRILENRESLESKLERHQDFWPKYHQVCRHSEELAELVPSAVIEAELASDTKDSPSRCAGRLQQLGLQGPADWKTRAAREHVERVLAYRKRALNDAADQMDELTSPQQTATFFEADAGGALKYLRYAFDEARVLAIGGLEVLRFGLQDISCQLCWASEVLRSDQIARVFRRDLEAVMQRMGQLRAGMPAWTPGMPSFWKSAINSTAFAVDVSVRPGGFFALHQWAESIAMALTATAGEFQALTFVLQHHGKRLPIAEVEQSVSARIPDIPVPRSVETPRAAVLVRGCSSLSFPKLDIVTVGKEDCASIWRKFDYGFEPTSVMLPASSIRLFANEIPSPIQLERVSGLLGHPGTTRTALPDGFSLAPVMPNFDARLLESSNTSNGSNKVLVFVCLHTTFCGGHGDRLFGLLSAFLAATLSKRIFYIDMRAPIPLASVLSPKQSWPAVTSSCKTYRWTSAEDPGTFEQDVSRFFQDDSETLCIVSNVRLLRVLLRHDSSREFARSGLLSGLFLHLFDLAAAPGAIVKDFIRRLGSRPLIGIHFRAGNETTWSDPARHSLSDLDLALTCAAAVESHMALPGDTAWLLAADTLKVRNHPGVSSLHSVGKVLYVEERPTHIDRSSPDVDAIYQSWAVWWILAFETEALLLSHSNFGWSAAEIGQRRSFHFPSCRPADVTSPSRAGRCTRSPTEAVPSQHQIRKEQSPTRRWQELLDNVAVPDSTCKKLRHMMIRRPQLGKGGQSRSLAPRRSKSPAEALPNAHSRTPNRKRSHGSKQALKPADLLKDGNIQSWADLGLGSIGYETRAAKEGRSEPEPSSILDQGSLQRELKDHLSMRSPSGPRCRRPSVRGKPSVPDVSPVLKRPASACALRELKDSTSMLYLQVCENQKVLPRPAPILTGHSSKLDARHQGLTDDELEASRVAIAALSKVESVDLEGNAQLTDDAVAKFLVSLGKGPGHTLTFLSLKGCTGTSFLTVSSMLKLIEGQSPAFDALQHLDLSGLKFGMQALGNFCDLAGRHPALQTLLLADVGLGATGASVSSRWIHNLLASQTLRELDLGWNLLDSEVFMSLGESVQHSRLRCLRISSCASAHGAYDIGKPAATFLEYLSSSCPLKELDISLNHIDYRAALVLEDLLSENRHLTVLDISFNPIGPVGMRSFVRLLLRERSGLHRVRFEGCAGGKHPVDDLQFMNANCPGARYSLQLDRPDHRSVLRMLYKSCDELKVNPGEAFFHVQFSEGAYKHPDVGADGIYAVPRKGRLQATFKIEKAIHQHLKVKEEDFLAFLRRRNDLMRLCPSDKKQVLLLHAWRAVSDVDPDQGVFLDALARDVVLPFAVVERMCRSCLSPAEVVSRLFPALRACASERCLILMIARSIPDVTQILQHARPLMFFNIQNPTGHYRLDLSHPAEHSIAEALVVLDSWESAIRIRHRHVDTSQFGDWSQVRNITFRGSPLQGPLTEWLLPEAGKLELDYSSSARPPEGAQVLDDKSFRIMLIALQDQNFQKKGSPSGAGPDQAKLPRDDMQALRMVAHQIYITALQTRALTECFMDPCDREDCLITFFNRIADMHNEKVFSVRFEGDDEQVNRLRTRLGSLVFFPWVQPEQARFVFQLDRFDERTALCALINLAKKERMTNIQKPRWVRGDGSVDPLVMGLPRSWETISQIPEHGTVSMSYKCAPEDRNFKVRKSFLQTYGNWPCDVNMEQVLWWASTNEVPVDVMEFLEFIIERYDDVYEAFDDIKSKNAQVLNHRDFEEGLRRVKCKKFKGRREGDKITGIFRYLDPSGEGQVTRSEWGILELCHKEMVYSIQEFVHFCSRSFGNDLNAAWAVFDVNGDNFISEAEWVTVARSFSYFGPTLPIFRFLDRDDEGTISFEEFEELQKFREPPRPDVQFASRVFCAFLALSMSAEDFRSSFHPARDGRCPGLIRWL
ncbi:Tonsoku-like protein [Symbiodinium microadriaticum]|uniref:Tonsoku-like protein n=1 Tax=Symbiodinium microadriaticum TaxID=2951 RepID=A0A1Q9EQD9_SYMMI|nr:Tonsoku-like protein [Symbiodinium microadriaticum]